MLICSNPFFKMFLIFFQKNRYKSTFNLYVGSLGSRIRNLHEKLHILIWSNHIFIRFLKNRPPGGPGGCPYPRIQLLRKIPEYLLLQTSTWIVLLRVTIVLARGILQTARILLALTNSIVW